MKRNIILTTEQKAKFEKVIKESKFNRLVAGLIAQKNINVNEKSRLILELKYKMFGK